MYLAAGSGPNAAVITIVWVLLFIAYWAPSIVASVRKVPNTGSVAVVNLFLGWTVIGWVVALAMAVRTVPAGPGHRDQAPSGGPARNLLRLPGR